MTLNYFKNHQHQLSMESVDFLQHCRMVDLHGLLQVDGNIGWEGWAALTEALSWRLHDIPHFNTVINFQKGGSEVHLGVLVSLVEV